MLISNELSENIAQAKTFLPIGKSFDLITRDLTLGNSKAYWIGVNGFCKTEVLQQIFSDLQNPLYMNNATIEDIELYMNAKIGYAQATLCSNWDDIIRNVLSGPSALFIDGFTYAIVIDVRTYPTRSVEEPDTERITKGARDGFVETMLFNTNLIRRRIRSPKLTFEVHPIGSESKTDVSIAYMEGYANPSLLHTIQKTLQNLKITSLTMASQSLEEILVTKRWFHPLPSIHSTERPDVASSFLLEGHILLIVDNSPSVLILPCTIFQFTQSPEDYYKAPSVGSYFRLVRFGCILIALMLMPTFLLITAFYTEQALQWEILKTPDMGRWKLFFYVIVVEFIMDFFKYSASINSNRFSGSLSIVGGLIISDVAVKLNWASMEVLFYAALTLLASLSISSIAFSDAIRLYRMFLILATGFGGLYGYAIACFLIILSAIYTPTFGGMSYFWPLYPLEWKALKPLLIRYTTAKAQPTKVWDRTK